MSATSLSPKPAPPVTGRLGRVRCRGYIWAIVVTFLTPRRMVAAALTASAGTAGVVGTTDRQPAPVTQPAPQPQPVVVKHPLPAGVTEDQVQKWIPNRRVSGRMELRPWQSVDAARATNPEVLEALLNPVEPAPAIPADITAGDEALGQAAEEPQEQSLRAPRLSRSEGRRAGTFRRLDALLEGEADSSPTDQSDELASAGSLEATTSPDQA
jgi:hypothetical protein